MKNYKQQIKEYKEEIEEKYVRIFCQSQFYRNNRIEHLILNFCMSRQNS